MSTASLLRTSILLLVALLGPVAAPARAGSQDGKPATGATGATETTGATGASLVDERVSSPRATMFTFLEAIGDVSAGREAAWGDVLVCLDFTRADVSAGSEPSKELARDLWGSLNRIRDVREEELPSASQLGPEARSFLYFPRPGEPEDQALLGRLPELARSGLEVRFQRQEDGRWLFSARTVAGVSRLYELLSPLERKVAADETQLETQSWLRQQMPASLKGRLVFELEAWQWLGLFALAFLCVLVDQLLRALLRPLVSRTTRSLVEQVDKESLDASVRPLGLLGGGLTALALIHLLSLPSSALEFLQAALGLFTVLAGTWAAWSAIDLGSEALLRKALETESKFDDVLIPLLRKTLKIFVLAFGVVYGAQSLHINIVPLITGLGIGGLAFAFAAKDTIENFFGSVAVILDRPFEVGDWVVIGDVEGTVEELGFRSTRIRTFYNSQLTVPNAALVRATVDNYGRRKYRRWKTTLSLQYDTPPEKLVAFTEGCRELVRRHPYTRKDYFHVWCNEFGDSSLNVLLYIFFVVPDWSTELRERERLFVDIVRLADRLGVSFAFPTRTVHVYTEQHGPAGGQHEPPGSMSDRRAILSGVRAAEAVTAQQPWTSEAPGPVTFSGAPTNLGADDSAEFTEDSRSVPTPPPEPEDPRPS